MTTINEERNYQELEESIGMMKSQRSYTEQLIWLKKVKKKKKSIDEVIKCSLKSQI